MYKPVQDIHFWIIELVNRVRGHYIVEDATSGLRLYFSTRATRWPAYFLAVMTVIAVFGSRLAPYHYNDQHRTEVGELNRLAPPSLDHPLGTTHNGYDVFSRVIIGTQPTMEAGFLGGLLIITIGMSIGMTAGYMRGPVEAILMRITDFVYGVPLIPFAIVLLALFGAGYYASILVIGAIVWRGSARVIRSQVLQIRESEYIKAAEAMGSPTHRTIIKHVFPNVMGLVILYFAIGVGVTITLQASLSFLGMGDPFLPSWGVMLRNVYNSGYMARAWWWTLPPGILLSLTVLSTLLLGRGVEIFDEGGIHG
ncbi:ABC transporter permease [Natronorarus salvus]|uniref:ABC transporter permease n=1 Tax=Natronorarus salvus TaxID=3117733 RepID=UPI002F26CD90